MLDSVHEVNERQKTVLMEKIERHFDGQALRQGDRLMGPGVQAGHRRYPRGAGAGAVERLLAAKATVRVYDPEAMDNVRAIYGDRLVYCQRRDDAMLGADALAICTEWKQFVHPDFDEMRRLMRRPVIFDGRNVYNPRRCDAGFTYYSIGRRGGEGGVTMSLPMASILRSILSVMLGLVFSTLPCAYAEISASSPKKPIRLENEQCVVEVRQDNGTITRFLDKASGIELTSSGELAENFRLLLLLPDKSTATILGKDQELSGVTRSAEGLTLAGTVQ